MLKREARCLNLLTFSTGWEPMSLYWLVRLQQLNLCFSCQQMNLLKQVNLLKLLKQLTQLGLTETSPQLSSLLSSPNPLRWRMLQWHLHLCLAPLKGQILMWGTLQ